MFDLGMVELGLAIFAMLLVGMGKAGVPGAGILVVPMMAEIFPAKQSTGILLVMLVVADICAVIYYRRHAQWKLLLKLLPSTAIGVIIGYFCVDHISDEMFRPLIGGIIAVMLILMVLNRKGYLADGNIPIGRRWAWGAGLGVGVTTMIANAAGPISAIYLLALRLNKNNFIGTRAWYMLLVNCFKLPFSASLGLITAESLTFNLKMIPAVLLGALFGFWLVKRISPKVFMALIEILAAISAGKMLFW